MSSWCLTKCFMFGGKGAGTVAVTVCPIKLCCQFVSACWFMFLLRNKSNTLSFVSLSFPFFVVCSDLCGRDVPCAPLLFVNCIRLA